MSTSKKVFIGILFIFIAVSYGSHETLIYERIDNFKNLARFLSYIERPVITVILLAGIGIAFVSEGSLDNSPKFTRNIQTENIKK